jgi:hypothetical protein
MDNQQPVQPIGSIARLQVQRSALKLFSSPGAAHYRYFDPAPLLTVPAMWLTPDGVFGLPDGANAVIDVHHRAHPETRNADVNGVSVGFTAHYALIRERFGEQLWDGIAGENILVAFDRQVAPETLSNGVLIESQDGLVRLENVIVAEPCVEFTRFALGLTLDQESKEDVTEGLRFLRRGTRGFYATYTGEPRVVRTGDKVFALERD